MVAGIALGSGNRIFIHGLTAHKIVGTLFSAIATAAIVATLEEFLFRGGIFGGLRRLVCLAAGLDGEQPDLRRPCIFSSARN